MTGSRVWVTGWDAVTPLGGGAELSFQRLLDGAVRRVPVDFFDTGGCRCREASVVDLPDWTESDDDGTGSSRATRLALPALHGALRHAGLEGHAALRDAPFCVSTTGGAMFRGEQFLRRARSGRRRRLLPFAARYQPQQQVVELQRETGMEGPALVVANACASGANAIGHAADLIRAGRADVAVAGGYEALTELIFTGFDCLQALSPTACRPFDPGRDGLMLGEGAAFLVLESEAHARARGAAPWAEVAGYGNTTDLHHLTQPAPDGLALARAVRAALARAGERPERIGYVNAHGTGTPMNDGAEWASYTTVQPAAGWRGAWIGSTKAAIGHTLGAAGAVEAVFALQALVSGRVPPQVATCRPLEGMEGLLPGPAAVLDPRRPCVLSANLGFGGSNAALLFRQP